MILLWILPILIIITIGMVISISEKIHTIIFLKQLVIKKKGNKKTINETKRKYIKKW